MIAGRFVIYDLGYYIVYLCIKLDDSRFSRSRDIIGVSKLKMGRVSQTTPTLKVHCYPYAGT